ncbi:MAG: N-acetylglutamate synthase-like GNAT family acetyltransferase [Paraglaciecola sp.]|jgi:N-acetylglutamate synthase-like GNAT family acetyltransferase
MIFRKAQQDDIDAISKLLIVLVKKYIVSSCSGVGGELILASMTPDAIKKYFDSGYQYHVAEDDGAVVGVVGMKNNSHLYHLFIADPQQGLGLSRTLWEIARDECLANGNTGMFTVNSALNAQNVYLKFGFKPIDGIREKFGIKDIPMTLDLYG